MLGPSLGAFKVEREQAGEGIPGRDVLRPAVGGGYGAVERVVGVGNIDQPSRPWREMRALAQRESAQLLRRDR